MPHWLERYPPWRVVVMAAMAITLMMASGLPGLESSPSRLMAPSVALAQAPCLVESEPNDDPDGRPPIFGAACLNGTLHDGDQDLVNWEIPFDVASTPWAIDLDGVPGTVTGLRIFALRSAAGEMPVVVEPKAVVELDTKPDQATVSVAGLLLLPGRYVVAVSRSDAAYGELPTDPPYSWSIQPDAAPSRGDLEPNDDATAGSPVRDAFEVFGDLGGSLDHYAWEVAEPGLLWDVTATTAPGQPVWVELYGPDGALIDSVSEDSRAALFDLDLVPGRYVVRIGPEADMTRPYLLSGQPADVAADAEPNDETPVARPIADDEPVRGRLARTGDRDRFNFEVPPGDDVLRDIRLVWRAPLDRSLCLLDAAAAELQCRHGNAGLVLGDLRLSPGRYIVEVRGYAEPGDRYLLGIVPTRPAQADLEAEPNDVPATANSLDASLVAKGRGLGRDDDVYRIHAEGEPQLWQIDAEGAGITNLRWLRADGTELERAEVDPDGQHAKLTDLYLAPGDHYISVSADDGFYRVGASPIGPPDPDGEREPNSEVNRAEAYRVGQRRIGRMSSRADADFYRFTLAAPEHLLLRLDQPADLATDLRLYTGGERIGMVAGKPAGTTILYDLALQPGDHVIELRAEQISDGVYTLTTERLDPFTLVADQEPNDGRGFYRPLPPSLAWTGSATRPGDEDTYAVPPRPTAGDLRITVLGDHVQARLEDRSGARLELSSQDDGSLLASDVPAEVALWLTISTDGDYSASVDGAGLEPMAELERLPVDMSIEASVTGVTAYWPGSQDLEARLDITNTGEDDLELDLDSVTSHYLWHVAPETTSIDLAAGERITVPLKISVDADAWADEPVAISLRARAPDGRDATTTLALEARTDAPPIGARPTFGVPSELVGGLNVAATGLGAVPAGNLDAVGEATLYDGTSLPGGGFGIGADVLPVEISVDLAGDSPVPIVGTIIDPTARDLRLIEMPRDFELLLSEDGSTWQVALTGRLSTLPMPQAFVLPEPLPASHAMLRILDQYGDRPGVVALGEWKVIAAPGVVPSPMPGDISDPSRGGHVVRMIPFGNDPQLGHLMLDDGLSNDQVYRAGDDPMDLVLAFQEDRAALLTGLAWRDPDGSDPARRVQSARVSVSMQGPLGPWRELGDWPLSRAPEGSVPDFVLPEPTWARFVRVVGELPADAASIELPGNIVVTEHATDDSYRSVLAEWGDDSPLGPFEWRTAAEATATSPPPDGDDRSSQDGDAGPPEVDAGNSQATASALSVGETATDVAATGVDEDWYVLDVPIDHNSLEVEVSGSPRIGVRVGLFDAAGVAQPVASIPAGDGRVRYAATVEPGSRYALRVVQPPFSAVFAFDTSGSMGPYLDLVLEGVGAFATAIEPGREVVMVLPFEQVPLLRDWQDDPYVVADAIRNMPVTADSSAAESALIDAADLLAERDGARAILLITDAITSSYERTPELWRRLEAVRPAVFAVHVGGGGEPQASRQLMQDWAASAGGLYAAPATAGDVDRAFDRMASWLRRPAAYELSFVTSALVLEPGSLAIRPPHDLDGRGSAPNAAVGIVLDTSGSMLERIDGKKRIDIAKGSLRRLVADTLSDGVPVALRSFGGKGKSKAARCETQLTLPLAPLERGRVDKVIGKLKATRKTATPIAAALEAMADDLAAATGPRIVVLVTDGAETCGGDPAETIRRLRESGLDIHLNIVGFALDDEQLRQTMRSWAEAGAGAFFDAADARSLATSISAAVSAPFRVLGPTGEVVAAGTVGSGPVALPPGTYSVEVLVDPPVRYPEVVVGSAIAVELVLEKPLAES